MLCDKQITSRQTSFRCNDADSHWVHKTCTDIRRNSDYVDTWRCRQHVDQAQTEQPILQRSMPPQTGLQLRPQQQRPQQPRLQQSCFQQPRLQLPATQQLSPANTFQTTTTKITAPWSMTTDRNATTQTTAATRTSSAARSTATRRTPAATPSAAAAVNAPTQTQSTD